MLSNRRGRRVRKEAPRDARAIFFPSQAPPGFSGGVSICGLPLFHRPSGLLNFACVQRNGTFPLLKQFLPFRINFLDRARLSVSGAWKHEIQNASPRAAISRIGSNSQVFGERYRTFADSIVWADISKNRIGALAVSLIENDREISGTRSKLACHSTGEHHERNPRRIHVARGIVRRLRAVG